jgi:RNA polymerase subunit RPABC4/transcription elongation factor Spt4
MTPEQMTGGVCSACKAFIPVGAAECPMCGSQVEQNANVHLGLRTGWGSLVCKTCGKSSDRADTCESCGSDLLSPLAADSVQHKRLVVHQKSLDHLTDLFGRITPAGITPTDLAQYLDYLSESDLLSRRYWEPVVDSLEAVDMTSLEAIHSKAAFESLGRLTSAADECFEMLRTVSSIKPPPELLEFHALLVAHFCHILDCYEHGVLAIFSLNEADAIRHGAELQVSLQSALDAGARLGDSFNELTVMSRDVARDTVARRLAAVVGSAAQSANGESLDLGAILSMALSRHQDIPAIGTAIFPLLSDLFMSDLTMTEELGLGLLAIAAPLLIRDNVLTLKRRTLQNLTVLRDASQQRLPELIAAFHNGIESYIEAEVSLLTIAESLATYENLQLSRDAGRMMLVNIYDNLAEFVWRKLASLPIYAMFLCEGSSLTFEQVAEQSTFGDKVQWLVQRQNSRHALALDGVCTLTRNAGSHGAVDTTGDKIRLTNFNPPSGQSTSIELTDEEFAGRIKALIDTCIAIRTALDVFLLENWEEFASQLRALRPPARLGTEIVKFVLGIFDLFGSTIVVEGNHVSVVARAMASGRPRRCHEYKAIFAMLAANLPATESADVEIAGTQGQTCRLTGTLSPFRDFASADVATEVNALPAMLAVTESSNVEAAVDALVTYRGGLVFNVAHALMVDVAALGEARSWATKDRKRYSQLLHGSAERAAVYVRVVGSVDSPPELAGMKDDLLRLTRDYQKAIVRRLQTWDSGKWRVAARPDPQIGSIGMAAIDLRAQTLLDAKAYWGEVPDA